MCTHRRALRCFPPSRKARVLQTSGSRMVAPPGQSEAWDLRFRFSLARRVPRFYLQQVASTISTISMVCGGVLGGSKSQHGKRGKLKLLDFKIGLEGQGSKVKSEQHGKRGKHGKLKLLDFKIGLEGQGSKVKSEQHGKRGKLKLLDTKTGLVERGPKPTTWKGWKKGLRVLHIQLFHPFHVVLLRALISSPILTSRSSIFPRFPRFPCCSEFTFEPCPSSPVLVSRSSIFPRFPCCSEFTFEPCPSSPGFGVQELHFSTLSMLAFWAPQHPPGNPGNHGNGGSDLPGMEAWVCSTRRAFSSDRPEPRSRRAQPCPASRSLARTLREFCALSSLSAPSVAPSLMDRVRALVRVLARRAELAARVPFLACIALGHRARIPG